MTACVNRKHTKKVAAVVTASLVGALSLGVAPVAAMAEGIDMLESDQDAWNSGTFEYTAEADLEGNYSVLQGDTFAVASVTAVGGAEVSPSDYTVIYTDYDADPAEASLTSSSAHDTLDSRKGGMPGKPGTYYIVVVEGDVDLSGSYWQLKNVLDADASYHVQKFTVEAAGTASLNGSFAYEVDPSDAADVSDTTFKYDGDDITVGFAKGKNALGASDFTIEWSNLPLGVTEQQPDSNGQIKVREAGTYAGTLVGTGAYKDSSVDFTFTVSPIDLENDVITIAPIDNLTSSMFEADGLTLKNSYVFVNGVQLDDAAEINVKLIEVNGDKDAVTGPEQDGVYTFLITPKAGAGENVTGESAYVSTYNVDGLVSYFYGDMPLGNGSTAFDLGTFDPELNLAFDPSELSASGWDKNVGYTYKVLNSEGAEVTSWDEPGEYTLVLETPYNDKDASGSYYGLAQGTFTVVGPTVEFKDPKYFVTVDGKNVEEGDHLEYTGEAFAPVYTVKDGKDTLVQGEDYTVTVTKGDDEVDEIKDPGTYVIHFALADTAETVKDYTIVVDKATIESAEPTADFFATDGETAAVPTFTGSTDKTFAKGSKFDLGADDISVAYYEYTRDAAGKIVKGDKVKAEDLTAEGWYLAEINVLTTCATMQGTGIQVTFQVLESAGYSDVAADAWYADEVYTAKDLGYMTGIKGTALFMPEADITRAELAKVFSNMAGRPDNQLYTPTRFGDVDAWAWYAEPIAWADEAGVVTGYDETTFGPNDKATREQVAVMAYRYAAAQGKDVTVEDADAALAAYTDGDKVADWAKDAMAWAVEQGIFGVDYDQLMPQDNITRAQVAAISVRLQPEALKK